MQLTERWIDETYELIQQYQPSVLVSEIVPSRGPSIMDQLYLANVQISTMHAVAMMEGVPVVQVSARSVQAKIAKRKPGIKKISKPQVRDGVLEIFPELSDILKLKNMKIWEQSDAIAIGAYYLLHHK